MKFIKLLCVLFIASCNGCIGDDFLEDRVDPEVRITSSIDTLEINTSFQLSYILFNNIGVQEDGSVHWSSSDQSIAEVRDKGLIIGIQEGTAIISIEANIDGIIVNDSLLIAVGNKTTVVDELQSTEGRIITTSSYALSGDFTFTETDSGVVLAFSDNYNASTALPGLYIYLSNNKNSISDALTIGKVSVFNGAHMYDIPDVGFKDYTHIIYFCKPFNVKVGEGEL